MYKLASEKIFNPGFTLGTISNESFLTIDEERMHIQTYVNK